MFAASWPLKSRLAARDATGDVGRTVATEAEYQRPSTEDLLQANFYRVQQSLRSMEEIGKQLQIDAAALEQLRYRAYELQRHVLLGLLTNTSQEADHANPLETPNATGADRPPATPRKSGHQRRARLQAARLYVLTDGCGSFSSFQRHVDQLLSAGVDVIQLRDKSLTDRELHRYTLHAAEQAASTETLLIVNDRPDLALIGDADGVHVGQDELPVPAVRRLIGHDRLLGLSTHDPQQVRTAQTEAIDYMGVGPVFPSGTKAFNRLAGPDLLRSVAGELALPAFAIGGIELANLPQVLATGFQRIAVQGALRPGLDIATTVARFREYL